jgi:type I restriction enzyme, S subunit
MSSDWQEITLGQFVRLQRGHDLTSAEQKPGTVPVMGSAGPNGTHSESKAFGPGVVIGRSGASMGQVHYCEDNYWPHNTCLYVTDFLGNDPLYVYYKLAELNLARFNSGSAQPSLNRNYIYGMNLSVPKPHIQKRIAQIIRGFDTKIENNRRINQTLEAMAQAIFKSWFVDFDPVKAKIAAKQTGQDPLRAAMSAISGKSDAELDSLPPDQYHQLATTAALFPDEMEESELGGIPMGWSASPFGSLLSLTIGGDWGNDCPDASNDTRVAIIRGTDIPDLDLAQINRVPIRYTTQKKLSSRSIKVGDIVLEVSGGSKDQPTGRSIRITENIFSQFDCPIEPASFCRLLRPISTEMGVILGLHLKHIYALGKTWEYQNQSTGISNFQTAHFLDAELVTNPPKTIADEFYNLVNPLLEFRHNTQIRRLVELRDTLLPKLLSGELSVSETLLGAGA